MFELGEYSKELHEKVGVEVYKNNIDILICNGENAKNIIKSAEKCGMNKENIYYFEEKKQVQEFVENNWEKGDAILFKASNGLPIACFMALLKDTRLSSACAMLSAVSCASISDLLTSSMEISMSLPVSFLSSARRLSMPAPELPMPRNDCVLHNLLSAPP